MRLLRYTLAGEGSTHIGMAASDGVARLDGVEVDGAPITTIGQAIAAALADPAAFAGAAADHGWDDIAFAVPADVGTRMLCAGANYRKKYPLGGKVQAPAQPVYFNKPPGTTGSATAWPPARTSSAPGRWARGSRRPTRSPTRLRWR
ncbi:hypothetical protein [Candidatus Poriferisodalis multihospitum]|uniref:hypothetical protein n=1 Tax=Candidatus Poriferisodalis multihospitum TaxID=2983191 RepID=UPI002B25BFAA|nr:hypothetical protein [Candidatus Poriferisodalis multihospitum]